MCVSRFRPLSYTLRMARSFRLNPELEERLALAAARRGVAVSVLIRESVRARCDEILGGSVRAELGDVVGAIGSGTGQSHRTGQAFADLLAARRRKPG